MKECGWPELQEPPLGQISNKGQREVRKGAGSISLPDDKNSQCCYRATKWQNRFVVAQSIMGSVLTRSCGEEGEVTGVM